jgi:hypothetical protein
MSRVVTAAALMAMSACAAAPAAEAVPVHGAGQCDAAKAKGLVGKARSKTLGAEALRLTGARTLRWIGPDTMVTMDYREDRLNLHLDARNRVTRINCG